MGLNLGRNSVIMIEVSGDFISPHPLHVYAGTLPFDRARSQSTISPIWSLAYVLKFDAIHKASLNKLRNERLIKILTWRSAFLFVEQCFFQLLQLYKEIVMNSERE
jgi:hypothetical protein